jgi:hypothetical protein
MKQRQSMPRRSSLSFEHSPDTSLAGSGGRTATPPTYGIDFVDRASVLQRETAGGSAADAAQANLPNRTGLPDALKSGIEALSGLSLADVRVHYDSPGPAQLQALAYTQGAAIHVAPGEERHLPHEAWHVVQQKQGRVSPTGTLRGTAINDDEVLESEADAMGARALASRVEPAVPEPAGQVPLQRGTVQRQRKMGFELEDANWRSWMYTGWSRAPYWKSSADFRNCRPMTKRELLHQGTGVRLEADEFVDKDESALLSDIEFVTDPFPLNGAGHRQLQSALTQIGEIYDRIIPNRGRSHRDGNFIKSNEAGFSVQSAMLSKGADRAKLKIQATQGFSLQDIPKAFDALAKPKSEADEPGLYAMVQHAMVGDQNAAELAALEPLRSASDRTWRVVFAYLNEHLDEEVLGERFDLNDDEFGSLFGFVTAAIGFLRMMRNPRMIQGGAKTYTPMMHRNDFATMFGMLSDRLKALLRGNERVFKDALIAGVVADLEQDDPLENYQADQHRDEFVFRAFILETGDRRRFIDPGGATELPNVLPRIGPKLAYSVLPPSFTIDRWVTEWMKGEDPKDILTGAHFELAAHNEIDEDAPISEAVRAVREAMAPEVARLIDWSRSRLEGGTVYLAFNFDALSTAQKEILTDYVRGLGGLGGQTDRDDPSLLLYENRNITPEYIGYRDVERIRDGEKTIEAEAFKLNPEGGGKLDMASARDTALNYFLAMTGLFGSD